jgi:hypothetical protein
VGAASASSSGQPVINMTDYVVHCGSLTAVVITSSST